ncbi:hypothetical protein MN116_005448 [Schistosoma mekongi]|uniref:Uncharacterized protein n=1 Tax=Schistosoma mekongi TaxID=38744 RepID=A0AAE2D5G1_SCHME|nr:hypothetical protein MN116_005448 [Schistosoma mekongi]
MKYKFTLLTSWTLLPTTLNDNDCKDNEADLFAEYLINYTQTVYNLNVYWPKQRGEAYLHNSFNLYEEKFLNYSEYTLLIISGYNTSCLDYIYPRFLVFFTTNYSWTNRIFIIFLKQPMHTFNFDVNLLKYPPIIFEDDASNNWMNDYESWLKINELITKMRMDRLSLTTLDAISFD